jgi:hypothetical protein
MITRIWHGAILATKSDEYLNLMRTPSRSPITARPPATRGLTRCAVWKAIPLIS